jgi:hypothetical protein
MNWVLRPAQVTLSMRRVRPLTAVACIAGVRRARKVLPGPQDEPAPGWYAYLTRLVRAGDVI